MPNQYTVQTGDTVDAIAKRFNVPRTAVSGYRSNDPNTIFPGETLTIGQPTPTTPLPQAPIITPDGKALQVPGGMPQTPVQPAISPTQPNIQKPTEISPAGQTQPPAPLPTPTTQPTVATEVPTPSLQPGIAPQDTTPGGIKPSAQPELSVESLLSELQQSDPELASKYKDILQPERKAISQYGINADAVETGFQTNPFGTLSALVQQVMKATGLPDVRENLTKISNEIESLANERDDKIREIQDNPWKSLSTKSTEINLLNDKYEQKIKNRTDRLTLIQNTYQQARQEAQFAATTAINLYDKQRQFDYSMVKDTLDREEKLAEATGKLDYSIQDIGGRTIRFGFNKTGEVISKVDLGPAKAIDTSGAGGLVDAITLNPQLFNNLTPSIQASIIPQLQAKGFKFPAKLSAEQEKTQSNATSALQAISTLEQKLYDPDGSINRTNLNLAISGLGTLAYARREAIDVLTRIRTGAALNESEQAFYAKQAPRVVDDAETIKVKLTQLKALYAGLAGTSLTLQSPEGKTYVYDNMFNPEMRNEVRQAISNGYEITAY